MKTNLLIVTFTAVLLIIACYETYHCLLRIAKLRERQEQILKEVQ